MRRDATSKAMSHATSDVIMLQLVNCVGHGVGWQPGPGPILPRGDRHAHPRMVLETRCDADDAVATDFVELIQSSAAAAIAADSGTRQHHHGGSGNAA